MASNARKRQKSIHHPSNGGTDETQVTAGSNERAGFQGNPDDVTAQIEKRAEERIERIKKNRSRNRRKLAKRVLLSDDEDEAQDNGDYEIPVKKLRSSESASAKARKRKKGIIERALSFLPGTRPHNYEELIDKLERMDEFGKAADVDPKLEAFMTFLYKHYWRVETTGMENIPKKGRTIIVSNHSGSLPWDGAMISTAIYKYHPARRYTRCMIEDWFGRLPFGSEFMTAVGQVRASQENAERLLKQEQLVCIFPEGIKGMAKGFKNRYNLMRFGRGGAIRLAIRTRTPVVPCAVVGAEEIYIVLGYANWLGKMLGMPFFPLSLTFPWLGPLGFIPLPTKWYMNFGKIIRYDQYDESVLNDNVIINRLNRELRATIQDMVDSLLKKRRSVFF